MRPRLLALAILLSACAPSGRHGPIDASHFVPATDAQLHALLGDYPTPGAGLPGTAFAGAGGVQYELVADRAHYATRVVAYEVGSPAPIPEGMDPTAALGPPDYSADKWSKPRAVSLGGHGSITLAFGDGALIDGEGADLFIWEIGPNPEAVSVEISADGKTWIPAGTAPGGRSAVDIGPYVGKDDVFRFVRLRDLALDGGGSDAWPGADIDAVAVLGTARRVTVPSEVLFAFDSDALADGASTELARVVDAVQASPRAHVTVEGHTDDIGADDYNRSLSERRAQAVAAFLVQHGVDRARLDARGFGKSRPAVPNDGDEGRRRNRRVEIVIKER